MLSPPLPLSDATLSRHAARVTVPAYDRTALTPSVVHMSVGSFHRSHQAVYFDDLAQRGISRAWGLVGVGLFRRNLREALPVQDGLYTVVERGADGDRARVIGAMGRYLYAPEDRRAVVAALADHRTRLVTLTVTADGYRAGPALDLLVAALDRRRRAGLPPFTVLSCDNLPANGRIARRAVVGHAARTDAGLARWIDARGAFPNSMVDRITPQTTAADRAMVERRFGIADRAPVITEPYSQWVIEDHFCAGRPPLDLVGARFVDDVRPHALIKTRLLNGAHCALGALGTLAGHETTCAALDDDVLRTYIERLMGDEVAPLLPAVRGTDLAAYRAQLLERLANPVIGDRLERLCRNGSGKVPLHIVSSLAEARRSRRPHALLVLAVAGWLRHIQLAPELDDPQAERLRGSTTDALLRDPALFGTLAGDADFADEVLDAVDELARDGVHAAMARRLGVLAPLAA